MNVIHSIIPPLAESSRYEILKRFRLQICFRQFGWKMGCKRKRLEALKFERLGTLCLGYDSEAQNAWWRSSGYNEHIATKKEMILTGCLVRELVSEFGGFPTIASSLFACSSALFHTDLCTVKPPTQANKTPAVPERITSRMTHQEDAGNVQSRLKRP